MGRRFASSWPGSPVGRTHGTHGTRVIGIPRIHYAIGIVSSCNNMDVTKRDISHFEVCSNRRIAVAVFVYAFLWQTTTFVSLQPKVAERTLCLATHVLHSTGFTQTLVLHIWKIRLSKYDASLTTRPMTSHYGEFLSNSDARRIAKIHADVSRFVNSHCSALRNWRRGALPG